MNGVYKMLQLWRIYIVGNIVFNYNYSEFNLVQQRKGKTIQLSKSCVTQEYIELVGYINLSFDKQILQIE